MTAKHLFKAAAAAAVIIAAASAACAQDWPTFKNNALRTGANQEGNYPVQRFSGRREWTAVKASQAIASSPAAYKGKFYFGTNDGDFCAVDAAGNDLWRFKAENWITTSPAVLNGRVYFGSYDSRLYCLDAETGGLIWRFTTHSGV